MKDPLDILIFKNRSTQYGVMHAFREGLAYALQEAGAHVRLLEFDAKKRANISDIYRHPPDCTLAFNGLHPFESGTFLADEIEVPHFAWLLDGAYYFRIMASSPYYWIICPDEDSRQLMKSYGNPHAYFLPHAFDERLFPPSLEEPEIPIAFFGSVMDYLEKEEEWEKKLPKGIFHSFLEGAERVLFSFDLSIERAFREICQEHPLFFDKLTFEEIDCLLQSFDYYIRGKHRILMLQGFKELPIHVFGNALGKRNWNHFLDIPQGNYEIHPSLDFNGAIKIIKKTSLLLNSSPMFKRGAHERIFYGLGLGSLVLSNATPWLKDHFEEGKEIITYDLAEMEEAKNKVIDLLKSPEKIKELASKGQKKVLLEHTWKQRGRKLLEIIANELIDLR